LPTPQGDFAAVTDRCRLHKRSGLGLNYNDIILQPTPYYLHQHYRFNRPQSTSTAFAFCP